MSLSHLMATRRCFVMLLTAFAGSHGHYIWKAGIVIVAASATGLSSPGSHAGEAAAQDTATKFRIAQQGYGTAAVRACRASISKMAPTLCVSRCVAKQMPGPLYLLNG